mgnify:CR=1 FL=1
MITGIQKRVCEHIHDLTGDNRHARARIVATETIEEEERLKSGLGGAFPFARISEALRCIQSLHEHAGSLSPELATAREALWKYCVSLAQARGYGELANALNDAM